MFLAARGVDTLPVSFPRIRGDVPDTASRPNAVDGFPRIRGDVPVMNWLDEKVSAFSPHTRGCSGFRTHQLTPLLVFPAYAGMFRNISPKFTVRCGFPRIRGDVPVAAGMKMTYGKFSPHTRGCSGAPLAWVDAGEVFPAYAGMFLATGDQGAWGACFPRIRGDVPNGFLTDATPDLFSPHTRGCSASLDAIKGFMLVFPAYAGMFLTLSAHVEQQRVFSPHTRGCSGKSYSTFTDRQVFPAYAGMFQDLSEEFITRVSFPRIRGDVPS